MSAVPERDMVDRCFSAAHKAAGELPPGDAFNQTQAIVYALEGLAHQIRDADDTQFNMFNKLSESINDLGIIVGGK